MPFLQDLPVDDLELDHSFVMRSADDPRSAVDLAHALNMRIIAEGVETQAVLDHLTFTGCDYAQGYHLAHPRPADQFTRWFTTTEAPVTSASPPSHRTAPSPPG